MQFKAKGQPMTAAGMSAVCDLLDVGEPGAWAVLTVETRGFGYLDDRRPQILFERHIFSRRTGGKFDARHPDISNRLPGGYKGGAGEYKRLKAAMKLDETAALESASWGLAQVMGFNAGAVGYASVQDMVEAFVASEDSQLEAMGNFIHGRSGCRRGIRLREWGTFAACYNGPNFRINHYDLRLAAAFAKNQHMIPDIGLRAAQVALTYLGNDPGPVDGLMGRRTRGALVDFQGAHGLTETGELNDDTADALHEAAFD